MYWELEVGTVEQASETEEEHRGYVKCADLSKMSVLAQLLVFLNLFKIFVVAYQKDRYS
jgi:hypothetical protein